MLVIYDKKGTVYFSGFGKEIPTGVPYLDIEVPDGKYLKAVDVTVTPNEPIFESYPKSEIELLQENIKTQTQQFDSAIGELSMIIAQMMGGESE